MHKRTRSQTQQSLEEPPHSHSASSGNPTITQKGSESPTKRNRTAGAPPPHAPPRDGDRKSVVQGKSEDRGGRRGTVTGVQTCALPIFRKSHHHPKGLRIAHEKKSDSRCPPSPCPAAERCVAGHCIRRVQEWRTAHAVSPRG